MHGPSRCLPVLLCNSQQGTHPSASSTYLPSLGVKLWKFFQKTLEGNHTCAVTRAVTMKHNQSSLLLFKPRSLI